MKLVCLFFEIHQPFRHKRYRFFDIGNDHYYYDDFANETNMRNIAEKSYQPTLSVLLKMSRLLKGNFNVALSVTGVALEQLELYAPEVIESLQKLAKTGCVEFLSETYSHSLASLTNPVAFKEQVKMHDAKIFALFGQKPRVFRNTEMIYSDEIGSQVSRMGFEGMLTEGAKHILGWKSPNYVYVNSLNPRLKVLMRNFKLSDDIAFRFSNTNLPEFPITAEKFISWIESIDPRDEIVNLFLSMEALGERQSGETGIFSFLEELIRQINRHPHLKLATPSEIIDTLQPISSVSAKYPISWADEERDLTAWLGNELQKEAFEKLQNIQNQINRCNDREILKDWNFLQTSDYFHFMSTKHGSEGQSHQYLNPFGTPYEAFINYMNILSDFKIRLNSIVPESETDLEIENLKQTISEKERKIKELELNIKVLQEAKSIKNRQKKSK